MVLPRNRRRRSSKKSGGGDLSRDDPRGDVFPNPNRGLDLNDEGVPATFNYYADVFYGTTYETEFQSYYEASADAANETEVPPENIQKVAGDITPPQPDTLREERFLEEFERKLSEQPTPPMPPSLRPRPQADEPGQLEIASWLPAPVREAVIKRAAMEAYYFLFDKKYRRADGESFQVRADPAAAAAREAACRQRAGRESRPRHAQHGHDGRVRRAAELRRLSAGRYAVHARLTAGRQRGAGRADRHRPQRRSTSPLPRCDAGSTSMTRSMSSAAPIRSSPTTSLRCRAAVWRMSRRATGATGATRLRTTLPAAPSGNIWPKRSAWSAHELRNCRQDSRGASRRDAHRRAPGRPGRGGAIDR